MDRPPEEMQHLGFFAIFKESFKIISKYKRIFNLITITLILPLAFIYLAQIHVSGYLYHKLRLDRKELRHTQHGTDRYHDLSDVLTTERIVYCVIKVVYYIILLVLSLLATSAVVYLVACVYTMKPITFKKVMSVVPKVWKRLTVTFFWIFVISLVYNLFTLGLYVILFGIFGFSSAVALTIMITVFIAYSCGFVYLCIVWHVASVISVLEDIYGIKAMVKAKELIKGKRKVVAFIFLLLVMIYFGILIVYQMFVSYNWNLKMILGVGIVCLVLLTNLFLLGLVVHSVIYFVCKSYHYEQLDKPALAEHLEAFLPDNENLQESKDVQMPHV